MVYFVGKVQLSALLVYDMRVHREAPTGAISRRTIRNLTVVGVILIGALNVADVITTHMVISRRGIEANPLAGFLLNDGTLLWVKLSLIGLAALGAIRIPPRLGILLLAWFAAGVYGTAVLSNALILRLT